MRLNISKAIAALALISVASLIAVSLLADVRGASAQMEERRVLTVTAANMPPVVSADVDRETRGTGDDAVQVPVIELSSISEDRQHESDPDADDVKVIHDFTGYFSDPDNQTLSFSLRGAPSGVFRLVTGTAKLIQVGDIEYDALLAAHSNDNPTIHVAGVDANDDDDYDDEGDTHPVLKYVFSTVASDGSAEASIEVTLPITVGEEVIDTFEFDIEENKMAAAGETLIRIGKIQIRHNGNVLDTEYSIRMDGSQNPDGLFRINPPGKNSGANKNVLWATRPMNYEAKASYVLVIETPNTEGLLRFITINVLDVKEPPFFVRHDIDGLSSEQAGNYCNRNMSAIGLTNPPIIRINENAAIGSAIADYDACDQDGDNLRFSIRNSSDSAYFDIHSGTGQLSVAGSMDYEFKFTYTIEVEVSDTEFVDRVTQRIRLNDIAEPGGPTPTRTAATPTPTRVSRIAATPTPTTTPARASQDVLHRVGALEQLLATLQTLIQSLQGVIAAQDSRIAAQDDKIAAQDGRIAALESQIATAATITPTPPPTATPSPTPTATPEPTAAAASACVQTIGPGSVNGSWTSACLTANPTHGNTYYARFYTFTLDAAADVTIALTSDKPPYLYLLAGAGTAGNVLRQAGGNNQTSVAITDTLQAGSYTIEASTWQPKTTGDFTLTLTARQ